MSTCFYSFLIHAYALSLAKTNPEPGLYTSICL